MHLICALLLAGAAHSEAPTEALTRTYFEVRGSAIGSDEYDAKQKALTAAWHQASARCAPEGKEAKSNGEAKDCQESYSVHGQSEICTFEFYCE